MLKSPDMAGFCGMIEKKFKFCPIEEKINWIIAMVLAKIEHPLRIIK